MRPEKYWWSTTTLNRPVAAQLVEKAGFAAHKASSRTEALAALERHEFVLVLMHCHVPEMDAFEATASPLPMTSRPVEAAA